MFVGAYFALSMRLDNIFTGLNPVNGMDVCFSHFQSLFNHFLRA